jgi:hypothetical protein
MTNPRITLPTLKRTKSAGNRLNDQYGIASTDPQDADDLTQEEWDAKIDRLEALAEDADEARQELLNQ